MMKTSKNQRQARKLILSKATLRILSEVQIAYVNGGDNADTIGVCLESVGYPCKDPEILTSPC